MHLLLYSVGCAASGADKSTNFTGIFSITLPNISLVVLSTKHTVVLGNKLSPSTQTTTVAPKLNDPPATLMPTAIY
jgi:hypothetical protein